VVVSLTPNPQPNYIHKNRDEALATIVELMLLYMYLHSKIAIK